MQKTKREPTKPVLKQSWQTRFAAALRRIRHGDWHWFDHPEMQARIQKAEADRREGRVEKFDSREAALAHLDSLA
ncbi:MAG TPA: hypothetical protein VGC13_16585 [Longimicrobium sp.]|jgi:hypothetical protein|uniref:hypothetical protein n=1 Tax=Longimicrobium sp. TaxID=2029185 RepID=UPI002ED9E5EF